MDEKTPDKDRPHRAPERSSSRRRWDEVDPSERPSKPSSRDRSETEKTRSREGKSRPHEESGYDRRRERERERSVERSGREVRRRSRSPDRRKDFDEFESDNERSGKLKGKEGYREERGSKGKEGGWSDRSREREKDQRKRRDHRDGDTEYEYEKDWDSKRRDPDWMDGDKSQGRGSYRKGGRSRGDGMRSGSGFSSANEHSDTIEIKPNKKLDFCRDVPVQVYPGRKAEGGPQPEMSPSGGNDEDSGYQVEDRGKSTYGYGDEFPEKFPNDGSPRERRSSLDGSSGKPRGQKIPTNVSGSGAGQTCSGGSSALFGNNPGLGSHNRAIQQGPKGGRHTRGVRGRPTGRDSPRVMMPMPMIAPPAFPLTMPPGPMPPMGPNIPPSPGPPVGPNMFMPSFPGHLMWPGARMDMTMLGVPPSLPPGPVGPRFPPNVGTGPNHAMYFNQSGPGRGVSPNVPGPGFSPMGLAGRGMPHDKVLAGWTPQRSSGPAGKAPSRGEQNDYSQNFVDTGMRPQNFIRELELTSTVEDYPKLRELIQKKDEIVTSSASAPMYYKCDLREHVLSPEFFGTKFDVILVDPPWEEYVHRAPGVADHMEYWTFEEILNLKIEAIADTPSFIFLWVGDGVGLEQGRQCLKKWGFRRCEDICWVKTNKTNATPSLRHDSHTLFQHTKEHCLMGIKGTVRRSTDGHIIHANIDTDIIIAEEPAYGSTTKPEDIYRIIEHFSLGRRRLELFGEDHNIRAGWVTLGKCLSSSNFNVEAFCRNFADKDGKVWQGGGGRNPPPDAPHLVLTTPDIESLRPKSPPQKNQQQPQPPSLSNTANSSKRPAANSPQNPTATPMLVMNQEVSSSNPPGPVPWASSPMLGGFRGLDPSNAGPDDKFPDGYGFNPPRVQMGADHPEFDPHRGANLL